MKRLFMAIMMLALMAMPAFALDITDMDGEQSDAWIFLHNDLGLMDKLKLYIQDASFTVIGGAACAVEPSRSSSTPVTNAASVCYTNSNYAGVAFQLFELDSTGLRVKYLGEKQLTKGQQGCFTGLTTTKSYHWDLYYCVDTSTYRSCTDYEGGMTCKTNGCIDLFKKGTLYYNDGQQDFKYEDTCYGSVLLERQCDQNTPKSTQHTCQYGCENGACKTQSTTPPPVNTCGSYTQCTTSAGCPNYFACEAGCCKPLPSQDDDGDTMVDLNDGDVPPNDVAGRPVTTDEIVVAPTTASKWVTIPIILENKRVFANNEKITVKATFYAEKAGTYMLEAGMGSVGDFMAIGPINVNTCDPGNTMFANKAVTLVQGNNPGVTFELAAPKDGYYRFWVAYVEGCGGKVLNQVKGDGLIQVGTDGDGNGDRFDFDWTILLIAIPAVMLLSLGGFLAFRKRR